MKKYITSILLLLAVQQIFAVTFYDQLCQFNFNWKKYKAQAPVGEARKFNSDKEYVQAHLTNVLGILRSNPVDQLNANQFNSRMHLIELLDEYRLAGNFPINYYVHERIPVFIDEHQTHCAVGYLLQQTGHEDMALRIASADNYAWLKDINDMEFPAWQQSSGFSLEELKLIQGAYDYYMPNALVVENKYEIPQKPACMTMYFENPNNGRPGLKKPENTWCKGEGENGVLNGSWIQNFTKGMPWITGYYEKGKRSGQWQEYYQGTNQLCRTENWRNDKLNGIRKRYDRSGKLIEEILFADGNAVTKTNHDLHDSLTWIRKPLDSNLVYTEVFTFAGAKIASGHERIYNPGNLLWFQNIELTALNSAAITSRDIVSSNGKNNDYQAIFNPHGRMALYNTPPLVEYKKEGDWIYYKEFSINVIKQKSSNEVRELFTNNYKHFGSALFQSIMMFDNLKINAAYDSIKVTYANNNLQNFYGYSPLDFTHLQICYFSKPAIIDDIRSFSLSHHLYGGEPAPVIKEYGQYNKANERIGVWKHYNKNRELCRIENYILARREDDED
ncbi:MAG: hypothetical protein ABI723_13405 [Bacteroidia bacterium]